MCEKNTYNELFSESVFQLNQIMLLCAYFVLVSFKLPLKLKIKEKQKQKLSYIVIERTLCFYIARLWIDFYRKKQQHLMKVYTITQQHLRYKIVTLTVKSCNVYVSKQVSFSRGTEIHVNQHVKSLEYKYAIVIQHVLDVHIVL